MKEIKPENPAEAGGAAELPNAQADLAQTAYNVLYKELDLSPGRDRKSVV